jgi:membrane protein required for colicin V production
MTPLNWLDILILGVLVISSLVGLARGLVREVLSLVAWGLAIWVGITFSGLVADYLETSIPSPTARSAAAFGILFLVTLLIAGMVGSMLTNLLQVTGLSGIDRVAGLLFGLARGILVITALVMLAQQTPVPREIWRSQSQLIPLFQSLVVWVTAQLPPGLIPGMVETKQLSR